MIFQNVMVFGAGTMGAGIAQTCALAGADVTLCDPSPDALRRGQRIIEADLKKGVELKKITAEQETAARNRLKYEGGLADCTGAELVIEAIPEELKAKRELFVRLDKELPPPTILATNTSTLSVTAIAAVTRFPDRVCGLHFLNPAQRMKPVEVVAAMQTAPDVIERCRQFIGEIGKEPIVAKDTPGFVVNRCIQPLFGEALRCLNENVAEVQEIDEILRLGGFTAGAFELLDRIGVDTFYVTTRAIWEGMFHDSRYRPHIIHRKMIEAGHLGRKAGRGFYEYPDVQ